MPLHDRHTGWRPEISKGKTSVINAWEAFIRQHCGAEAKTMQYLCLPSRTGWELKVYDALGVPRNRILGIERSGSIGCDILAKDWGIPVFAGELNNFIPFLALRPDLPQAYDVVNVDLCGTVKGENSAIKAGVQLALTGLGRCLSVTTYSAHDSDTLQAGSKAYNYIRSVLAGNPDFSHIYLHILREITILLQRNDSRAPAIAEVLRELAFVWTIATAILEANGVDYTPALTAFKTRNGTDFRRGTGIHLTLAQTQDFQLAAELGNREISLSIAQIQRFIYISETPARMRTWFIHLAAGPPLRFTTVLYNLLSLLRIHPVQFYDQQGINLRL